MWSIEQEHRIFNELELAEAASLEWLSTSKGARKAILAICCDDEEDFFDHFANGGQACSMADATFRFQEARTTEDWRELLAEYRIMPAGWKVIVRAMKKAGEDVTEARAIAARVESAMHTSVTNMFGFIRFKASRDRMVVRDGYDVADLEQEGAIAVVRAFGKFRMGKLKSQRFTTYAGFWVQQSFARYRFNMKHTIRIPVHLEDEMRKIRAVRARHEMRTGRAPDEEVLAKEVGMTVAQLRKVQAIKVGATSLDKRRDGSPDDEESTLYNFVGCPARAEDDAQSTRRKGAVEALLAKCTPKERFVIERRFGLGDKDPMTLGEVGALMGVTRERVRQVEMNALAKMTRVARVKKVRLDDLTPMLEAV